MRVIEFLKNASGLLWNKQYWVKQRHHYSEKKVWKYFVRVTFRQVVDGDKRSSPKLNVINWKFCLKVFKCFCYRSVCTLQGTLGHCPLECVAVIDVAGDFMYDTGFLWSRLCLTAVRCDSCAWHYDTRCFVLCCIFFFFLCPTSVRNSTFCSDPNSLLIFQS